ncbi:MULTISPECIES: hypothetical protein [Sphingobacterium]|uniref:hypothetical protein n=1 Tax=Sphingobacterium TaxID=28453 RepID=UPI0013E4DA98|nr:MULTISPECIES: hypothetical protein [Sphingobacterium]QIH33846.1 hypothetical protein G6053_13565 [Sphingobacterium sp. DR205]
MKINDIRIGAVGGTLCSLWASISLGDILQTLVTAALGTLVSFATSQLLGRWARRKK